jgi:hypothetical protein
MFLFFRWNEVILWVFAVGGPILFLVEVRTNNYNLEVSLNRNNCIFKSGFAFQRLFALETSGLASSDSKNIL